jgi:hypothetical protein
VQERRKRVSRESPVEPIQFLGSLECEGVASVNREQSLANRLSTCGKVGQEDAAANGRADSYQDE